ncbi:MAG: hypothetical protein RLZZ401_1285 [Pseudomonadota bacterium]|jgi:release factor glutamine methyltransferase
MHIAQALQQAVSPALTRLEAQLLLLHVLGRLPHDRAWLLTHDQDALDTATQAGFYAACQRRAAGEPLAYITGHKAFYGLDLAVDARVLDPRADTETLVDWALERLRGVVAPQVLDLGTGSGAIALAVAQARPDAWVGAVDASADALAVAQANAQRLGLTVRFSQGDWFANALPTGQRYHLILSNPPYIAQQDAHLDALRHEPLQALVSGPDGLDAIRHLVAGAPACLQPGGWLLLEHGHAQEPAVAQLLRSRGFGRVQSRHDLAANPRCSGGFWPDAQQQ